MTFGERVKQRRKELGWTQVGLALRIGTTAANICRYEQGQVMPSLYMAIDISKALRVSLDWLAGRYE